MVRRRLRRQRLRRIRTLRRGKGYRLPRGGNQTHLFKSRLAYGRKRPNLRCSSTAPQKQHTLSGVKSVCELFYERDILVNPDVDKDLFSGNLPRKKLFERKERAAQSIYLFFLRQPHSGIQGIFLGKRRRTEKDRRSCLGRTQIFLDVETEKIAA